MSGIGERIKNTVSGAASLTKDAVTGSVHVAGDVVKGGAGVVGDVVGGTARFTTDAVKGAAGYTADTANSAAQYTKDTIVGAGRRIGGATSGASEGAKETAQEASATATGVAEGTADKAKDVKESLNIKLLEENPFESFEDRYEMGTHKLGRGVYGTVWECFEKKSGKKCAVKVVERSKLNNREDAFVINEVKLLRRIKHPHVVRLYHVYTTHMSYHIVMEICEGGELLERIVRKGDNGQRYTEREARSVVRILLEALCYCHSKRIVHRDVKPENLLLDTPGDDAKVKLTDFGLAEMLNHPNDTLKMQCGTPCYMAPELLKGEPYSYPVDLWSAGIVTFVLLGGYHPFLYGDNRDLHRKIMTGQALLQPEKWKNVSKDAKDMVLQMLCIDSNTRITAAQALKHAWMKVDDSALENNSLSATVDELRGFNARRRFRAAADVVMLKNYLTRSCYLKKVVSTDDVHEVVAMSRCALRIEEDLQEELKEEQEEDDLEDTRGVMF